MTSERMAMLIVDAQVNMFDPAQPVWAAEELCVRLANLIKRSRAAGVPVIFVRNCGGPGDPDARGTPGWELPPSLAPVAGELVLDKRPVTRSRAQRWTRNSRRAAWCA